MMKHVTLTAALALMMAGCGAAGGSVESCNAGWNNYCAKLFNCNTDVTNAATQAYQSEANCKSSFTNGCAAVQYYTGTCATKYNSCVGSLQGLTCADFDGSGSFDTPAACKDTGC